MTTTTTELKSLNDGNDALLLFRHLLPLVGIIVKGRGEPIHKPTNPTAESTSNIAIGAAAEGGEKEGVGRSASWTRWGSQTPTASPSPLPRHGGAGDLLLHQDVWPVTGGGNTP